MNDKLRSKIAAYEFNKALSNFIRKPFNSVLQILQIAFFLCTFSLYSTPDLSIVGYVMPEDGLGKVPINILETLEDSVSANIIDVNFNPPLTLEVPSYTIAALQNIDKTPGRVAMLTVGLWSIVGGKNAAHMPKESIVKLAYSMFETTRIPSMWVKILNEEFDAVVVPDPFLVEVYKNCGVNIPIFVLPIPMILDPYFAYSAHSKSASFPFVFGDASANKNPGVLVKAFAKAFGNSPYVRLVMRAGHVNPETRAIIDDVISKYGLKNVIIEDGHISLAQYIEHLSSLDCYVNLSKGEGFSLIPREALALGIPTIVTDNTASSTICHSGFVRAVPSSKLGSPREVYKILFNEDCGHQFDCREKDVKAALLDVYHHYGKYIKKARQGRKWVTQYDCKNPELQSSYRTLIKPQQVILGDRNAIENGTLITNSLELYQKYIQLCY